MKRVTVFLFAAIVAMVLVYPATAPIAGPPTLREIPTPQIITPQTGIDEPVYSGENDGGDADDLAGAKNAKTKPIGVGGTNSVVLRARLAVEYWRIYFFGVTLIR